MAFINEPSAARKTGPGRSPVNRHLSGRLFLGNLQTMSEFVRSGDRAAHELALRTARISRVEGMEGHARAAELRLSPAAAARAS